VFIMPSKKLTRMLPEVRLARSFLSIDRVCFYLDRYRTKYHGKVRLGPLFSEGFRFMYLVYLNREIYLCSFKNRYIIFQMAKLLCRLSTINTGLLQVLLL
jgi:hypothetical protein